jgi:hypothetical protein
MNFAERVKSLTPIIKSFEDKAAKDTDQMIKRLRNKAKKETK